MVLERMGKGGTGLDVRGSIIIIAVVGVVDVIFILSTDGTFVQKRYQTTVSLALTSRVVCKRDWGINDKC